MQIEASSWSRPEPLQQTQPVPRVFHHHFPFLPHHVVVVVVGLAAVPLSIQLIASRCLSLLSKPQHSAPKTQAHISFHLQFNFIRHKWNGLINCRAFSQIIEQRHRLIDNDQATVVATTEENIVHFPREDKFSTFLCPAPRVSVSLFYLAEWLHSLAPSQGSSAM